MGPQVGELDSCSTVMFFDKLNSHLFIEREPLLGIGGVVWIVAIHGTGLVEANASHKGRAAKRSELDVVVRHLMTPVPLTHGLPTHEMTRRLYR